jgi:hypothetical protein
MVIICDGEEQIVVYLEVLLKYSLAKHRRITSVRADIPRDRVPMRWIFSNLPNHCGPTMSLGATHPLTEMSTRNLKKETWGYRAAGA